MLFTNFSWNEIGYYDLPAMIDYVLNVTKQDKLFYVGHSQGTTAFFVMTSEKPEYNDKIKLATLLAPIAYMSNMKNPFFHILSSFEGTIDVSCALDTYKTITMLVLTSSVVNQIYWLV